MVHGESEANVMVKLTVRDTHLMEWAGKAYEVCPVEQVFLPGCVLTEPFLQAGRGIVQKCVVFGTHGQFWAYVSPQDIEPIED